MLRAADLLGRSGSPSPVVCQVPDQGPSDTIWRSSLALCEARLSELAVCKEEKDEKDNEKVAVTDLQEDTNVYIFINDKERSLFDTILINLQVSQPAM